MAVYKLGELSEIQIGKTPSTRVSKYYKSGTVRWYSGKEISESSHNTKRITDLAVSENSQPITTKNTVLLSMMRHIHPLIPIINSSYNQAIAGIECNPNKLMSEYLYYYLEGRKHLIKKEFSKGTTIPQISKSDVEKIEINLPSLSEQEKIIEIIKPAENLFLKYPNLVRVDSVENCEKDIKDLIEIIKPLEDTIGLSKTLMDLIINLENILLNFNKKTTGHFIFEKGGLPENGVGITPFLNVAAANGNINRFVPNKPNIFVGDVTISLDGNCGLVNNDLEGYNGYLYKVTSKKIEPWQVYYSLKTKESQQIILLNETGTTIKHASGAKKELFLCEFEYGYYLKELFNLRIKLSTLLKNLSALKNIIINLLIK